jgi:hypothetical protein
MLKKPTDIHGVVEFPVWDFIEVTHYVYPVLHGEIGLVNNALDAFYDILDDNIEVMSDEEKIARNTTILANAALEASLEKMQEIKDSSTVDISFFEIFKSEISSHLRRRGISEEENNRPHREKEEINAMILDAKKQQKEKEQYVKLKR